MIIDEETIAHRENQKMLEERLRKMPGFQSLVARGGITDEHINKIRRDVQKPELDTEGQTVRLLSVWPDRKLSSPELTQSFVDTASSKEGSAQEAFISGYGDIRRPIGQEREVWQILAKIRSGDLKPDQVPNLDDMVEGMLMRLFEDRPLPVMVDSGVDMADSLQQITKKDYLAVMRESIRKFLGRDINDGIKFLRPETLERLRAVVA